MLTPVIKPLNEAAGVGAYDLVFKRDRFDTLQQTIFVKVDQALPRELAEEVCHHDLGLGATLYGTLRKKQC